VWWYTPLILAPRKLRQEGFEFKVSLGTQPDPVSKKKKKREKRIVIIEIFF
jgi:hypothetical protein